MRNLLLFGLIMLTVMSSLVIGIRRFNAAKSAAEAALPYIQAAPADSAEPAPPMPSAFASDVPHIGSVQVLNGCGAEGAATRVADFLRSKNFDVKDIGNAPSWNYPATMIVSRTTDMGLANEIERFMRTGKVALIRNGEQLYDVTIIAGPDFESRIR